MLISMAQWRGSAVSRWRGGALALWRGGAGARWRGVDSCEFTQMLLNRAGIFFFRSFAIVEMVSRTSDRDNSFRRLFTGRDRWVRST